MNTHYFRTVQRDVEVAHASTAAGATSFSETVATDGSTHTYAVQAQDPLTNKSAQSAPLTVVYSTPAVGGGGSRLSIGLA